LKCRKMMKMKELNTSSKTKKPNFLIVYGKKPRNTKNPLRGFVEIDGVKLFLHQTAHNRASETAGNVNVYMGTEPYALIVSIFETKGTPEERVIDLLKKNIDEIKQRLKTINDFPHIPKEVFLKVK